MTITMNRIPTAMTGVTTVSLNRTLDAIRSYGERNDMAAEYELAGQDDLLDLVPVEAPKRDERSTAQVELMNKLMGELSQLDPEAYAQGNDYMHRMTTNLAWTSGREGNASRWIDRLIAKVREARTARKGAPAGGRVELEDGVYRYEDRFYMVQHAIHGSGNQYAKLIHTEDHVKGERFQTSYAAGMIRNLRPEHKLSDTEAAEFGRIYGTCMFCHLGLTDDRSKAAGYGRKCAQNRNLPWG